MNNTMINTKMRVLLVEDMSTMRRLMKLVLAKLGFTDIIEAADGAEGFQQLSRSEVPVGMIISDYNMPNSTGMDLLKRVRAEARFKDTIFMMVTAEGEAHQIEEARKHRVDDYIIKPFNAEKLQERLQKLSVAKSGKSAA